MVNQQVTLLSFNNGTSETACDITFKFDNYLKKFNIKNKRFLVWFIGFSEKASFIILNNKVYFDISVSIKDIQVIYYIKPELGFGKVMIKDQGLMIHILRVQVELSLFLLHPERIFPD